MLPNIKSIMVIFVTNGISYVQCTFQLMAEVTIRKKKILFNQAGWTRFAPERTTTRSKHTFHTTLHLQPVSIPHLLKFVCYILVVNAV